MTTESVTRTSVLGDSRPADIHPGDGFPWFTCPFCSSPVYFGAASPEHADTAVATGGICNNGWCLANPQMPLDAARLTRGLAIIKEREEAVRTHDHNAAMARIREAKLAKHALEDRLRTDAEDNGFCLLCLFSTGGRLKIRHRAGTVCPKSRRR